MSVQIDDTKAKKIFAKAILESRKFNFIPSTANKEKTEKIILGSHLTYRYIFITGLLAKATNDKVNPICLQAGSDLTGAYDARSLCHGVVVQMERDNLAKKLGASNEPFLNKPARYKELSTNNAVRRGNDRLLLSLTIEVLSSLKNSEDAYSTLVDACYFIGKRDGRTIDVASIDEQARLKIINFVDSFVAESHEGETCAIAAGGTFFLLTESDRENTEIKVHPANQCGASSKEISDIDVYVNGEVLYTSEIKDKKYTLQDVDHAVRKAKEAGMKALLFVNGPRGVIDGTTESELMNLYRKDNFHLVFIDLQHYTSLLLFEAPTVDIKGYFTALCDFAKSARVKDETFKHLQACIEKEVKLS